MKIIAENPAEEALLWRIKALSDELVNQDNRSTDMPMWTILDNNKAVLTEEEYDRLKHRPEEPEQLDKEE